MKVIDGNYFGSEQRSEQVFDFCIIGAGVAGLILADQLCDDYKIAIIESGDFNVTDKAQELNSTILSGEQVRNHLQNRIRQVGGTSNVWAGRSLVLSEFDFLPRPWIDNSGWPFTETELTPYYSMLYRSYEMADFSLFQSDIDDTSDELYQEIFRGEDLESIKALWAKKVTRFGRKSKTFSRLHKSPNLTLFKNSTVRKLREENRSVVRCDITALSKRSFSISSKTFILAAGGIENARVLLSSNDQDIGGIGNQYGNVGSYYMDHPTAVRKGIKLTRPVQHSSLFVKPLKNGRFKNVIRFSNNYQEKNLLTNNHVEFSVQYPESYEDAYSKIVQVGKTVLKKGSSKNRFDFSEVGLTKIPEIIYLLAPSELAPHFMTRGYHYFNKVCSRPLRSNYVVLTHHLEQVPNKASCVTLSRERNHLDINKVNLNWKIGNQEVETAQMLEDGVINKLKQAGWLDNNIKTQDVSSFSDASHHIGTTRMHSESKKGVVDINCKVHTKDNLYVAGSSVFPTSGSANPTYTIAALSLRLADHLREMHEKT